MSLPPPFTRPRMRLYYVDWLRVISTAGIFLFHNARIFNAGEDWHVKNAESNLGATFFVMFLSQWIMPLFFLIAGAGTYYALKSRTAGQFAGERTVRLLVPFIFGMLVIVVPQAYVDAVSHGGQLSQYNIFQIYGLYLKSLPEFNTFHLWFLFDLFMFSMVTIPLFTSAGSPDKSVIKRLAGFFERPWALVLLLVLSIAVVNMLVYPAGFWGYRNGGWNIITYLLFFIFGYLVFANQRIPDVIYRMRWIGLAFGVASLAFIVVYVLTAGDPDYGTAMYNVGMLVQAAGTWGWLFAILGFGSRFLNRDNRALRYANEAALPFYILHQTVIVVIGFFVVRWAAGAGLKYLVISTASFIVIMLIYELLVRRINVLRFLFGMRWSRKPAKAAFSS